MAHTAVALLALVIPLVATATDADADADADAGKLYRTDHAVVSYMGLDEKHAEAIAAVIETAREAAIEQFGFDMPDTVAVKIQCDPAKRPRLFTDGQDRLFLTIRSERDLRQPRHSGIFNLYGLCHELGHLAMYRVLRERGWMTTAAAEGWAHFVGSRLVDEVYRRAGPDVWPDRYDYRADGTQRLNRQLRDRPTDVTRGAGQWMKLGEVIGDKGFGELFAAWAEAEADPADPAAALRQALLAVHDDQRVAMWWNDSEKLFVLRRPRSGFTARTLKPADLAPGDLTLSHDDGQPAGKNSIAGSGHGVRFSALGPDWYLAAVSIHGSRYGTRSPPGEDFHVYLCDLDFNQIADFPVAYATFTRSAPRWVTISVPPTQVPWEFIVCVAFNPSATKGVFVSRDAEASGHSLTGLPGRGGRAFTRGDWLIRTHLRQAKSANALIPQQQPEQSALNSR